MITVSKVEIERAERLGWSAAINRWLDPTGVWHYVIVRPGAEQASAACGSSAMLSGQVNAKVPEGQGRACERCSKWVAR